MDEPPKKKSLYLVAGSVRKSTLQTTFPFQQLWKEGQADLSHTQTYQKKATTMDIEKSKLPDQNHIIGSVHSYDFNDYVIKAAYLERLPTFEYMKMQDGSYKVDSEKNYLGESIQNIGKAMKQGAKIEIEWHPYLKLPRKDMHEITSIFDEEETKKNPFTATIDPFLMCTSVQMAYGRPIPEDIGAPKKFVACSEQLSKTLQDLILFYAENGVGSKEQLEQRIIEELWLWCELDRTKKLVALSHSPNASLEDFSQAIKKCVLIDNNYENLPIYERLVLEFEIKNMLQSDFRVYNANHILTDSLLGLLLCDAAAIHNGQYVIEFMLANRIKNPKIRRTTSKRNGRTNVWILKGTKA